MEVLLKMEEGFPLFIIGFPNKDFETRCDFMVHKVESSSEDNEPIETEPYIKGFIKWDGDAQIQFGDTDGEIFFGGKYWFDIHKKLMTALWNACTKKIIHFDKYIAS